MIPPLPTPSSRTMRIDILSRTDEATPGPIPVIRPPQPRVRETSRSPSPPVSDSNFEELFQRIYDGALITDLQGHILDANDRVLESLGYDLALLLGTDILGVIVGAGPALLTTLLDNLQNNRFTLIQAFCRRQDNSTFPAEIAVSRLAVSGRDHMCFFIRDITRRLQAEESLRQERNLLRTLIDLLPDYIYVKDTSSRFIIANKAVSALMGATPDSVVGRTDRDFFPPDLAAGFQADERRVLETGRPLINKEETCVDAQGRPRLLLTTKVALQDPNGRISGIVGIGKDITEQRLIETQRSHAQKMESIGQLAAGIAHEINTPIQYIGDNIRFLRDAFHNCQALLDRLPGFFDDLAAGQDLDTVRARFREASEEADLAFLQREIPAALDQSLDGVGRVARIVHAMKEFSHPDSEEKLPADLNRAIESTVTVSRNEWKYVAEVVTDLDSALPPVPCYVGHFNQVMLNLIVNAAHAIAEKVGDGSSGKGRIRIATRRDGDWAEIRVEDDGAGIPEAIRHRIFEPFFTTKEVGKGTGQGLSTCHAIIVRKHGGHISFESEVGRGTVFTVRLPLADDAPQIGSASPSTSTRS